jgi:hypothetical protein
MGLNFSAPHLTGDVAHAGERAGERAGAEATANLLRIVESGTAKVVVWGTLMIVGAFVAYTIAVGLHREFGGAKPPVEHSVLHHTERAPPPPAAAAATPAAP